MYNLSNNTAPHYPGCNYGNVAIVIVYCMSFYYNNTILGQLFVPKNPPTAIPAIPFTSTPLPQDTK